MIAKKCLRSVCLLLLTFGLSGCANDPNFYRGADASALVPIVPAQSTVETLTWKDFSIRVEYQLERSADVLSVKGRVTFADSARASYTQVRDLRLKLFLLDRSRRVVSFRNIARVLSSNLEDWTFFDVTLPIDSATDALTFGYDGKLIDNDPESPSASSIWKIPARKKK